MPITAQYQTDVDDPQVTPSSPISLYECSFCGLLQLKERPKTPFKSSIRSSAVSTEVMRFKRNQLSDFIKRQRLTGMKVLEVGAGVGDYLECFRHLPVDSYGLEADPQLCHLLREAGYKVIHGFPATDQGPIASSPFAGFFCFNFLEHQPDPKEFLRAIKLNLTGKAKGLIEVPNGEKLIMDGVITEIMLEHQSYFSNETLKKLVELCGFRVLDFMCHSDTYTIGVEVEVCRTIEMSSIRSKASEILHSVSKFVRGFQRREIVVWGAGHQSISTIAQADLHQAISYVVDSSKLKQGKTLPGSTLIIHSPERLNFDPDLRMVLIICGGYNREIVQKLTENTDRRFSIATLEPNGSIYEHY